LFVEAIVARKNSLANDFQALHARATTQRAATKGPPTATASGPTTNQLPAAGLAPANPAGELTGDDAGRTRIGGNNHGSEADCAQ
jgi:hypothetical protein